MDADGEAGPVEAHRNDVASPPRPSGGAPADPAKVAGPGPASGDPGKASSATRAESTPGADADGSKHDDRWFRVIRRFIRRNSTLNLFYRVVVGAVGIAVVVLGLFLIPLPGPGWLIVFAGLAVLATEFSWAGRLLHFARRKVQAWTRWMKAQSLFVRGLVGLFGLVVLALVGVAAWYWRVNGPPGWLPGVG